MANNVKVNLDWVESETFEGDPGVAEVRLAGVHGILVPGGFGERGAEGKIRAAQFARERGVPLLNSVESAASSPHTLRAYSMTSVCIPRQMPKYGTLRSRAKRIALSMPSMPRLPNPPGTRMPS